MASVKSFSQDPAKKLWRERMVDFVRKHYTPNQIRNFRVLCFAGKEMAEVFDVYDPLRVKRKNVVSLECDRGEYEEQAKLNETLEQRIKVVPASALDYFSRQPAQTFDMISLDYCGYFNDEKVLTLNRIALNGWLSPKAVLFTNYQSGRENAIVQRALRITGVYAKAHKELVDADFEKHRKFVLNNTSATDDDTSLETLRDSTIQCTPVAEMVHGTGFWNTDFFKVWLECQPKDTKKLIKESLEILNTEHDPEHRELIAKFMIDKQDPESALLMVYLVKSQMRSFDCKSREAYKYVSNTGTPMISDFYLFEEEQFRLSERERKSITYERAPAGLLIRIKDRQKIQEVYRQSSQHVKAMTARALMTGETKIILERIVLKEENLRNNIPTSNSSQKRKHERDDIYTALSSSTPDEEIMETYELSKPQLAGYKATYAKRNNHNAANRNGKNILPEDLEVIGSLWADGYKATEIVQLFEDEEGKPKYSWQSIAAYKAALTRTKAAASGTLSNERLFERLKPEILGRDKHICQWCSTSSEEQQKRSGHAFHVHHINYDHEDTRRENLVTLCTSCHARTNTIQNGLEMKEYFELLMEEKYSVVKA